MSDVRENCTTGLPYDVIIGYPAPINPVNAEFLSRVHNYSLFALIVHFSNSPFSKIAHPDLCDPLSLHSVLQVEKIISMK